MSREAILLLGGTGFIGSALARRLMLEKRPVHIVGRHNIGQLETLLPLCDTVIHLASATTPGSSARQPEMELGNLALTTHLLELLQTQPGTHLIYFSSGGTVYGNPEQLPVTEDALISPLSNYGVSKTRQEAACQTLRSQGCPVTILRPSNAYGPGQTLRNGFGLIRTLLEHARCGTPVEIWGDGESVRDFIYIDDIVEATALLIDRPQDSGTYNLGRGMGHSINQVLSYVESIVGNGLRITYRPARGVDVTAIILDNTRLKAQLGWQPVVGLAEGVARTWASLQHEVAGMRVTPPSVCAVVVAFHPDAHLEQLLHSIIPQVRSLIVIDNTPADARRRSVFLPKMNGRDTCLIENMENLGVGAALNLGIDYALQQGCEWLLTLDQDSQCHDDLVMTLLTARAICDPPPVIIGSNYLDPRNGVTKVKTEGAPESIDQNTVITSGTLVDARFAKLVGGFRADYFIDQLDHEFCLRARAYAGRVIISRKVVMAHSVGETGGAWLPVLGYFPNHSPLRKYYIARNTVVTIANYWRREPAWCLRRASRLILGLVFMGVMERQRVSKVRAFMCGIVDGLSGRMGPCQRIALVASATVDAKTSLAVTKVSHDL